jgi:hypothetical protein
MYFLNTCFVIGILLDAWGGAGVEDKYHTEQRIRRWIKESSLENLQ